MKCTYHWLKEFVDFDFSPEQLAEKLTILGLEVDGTENIHRNTNGAIVGEVVETVDGNLYKVKTGRRTETIEFTSGQLQKNQKVVLQPAKGGTRTFQISTYESLGLSDEKSVVFVEETLSPGDAINHLVPETDTVYDIDLTPNRADCLSVIGIARDISALTGNPLRNPDTKIAESGTATAELVRIGIEAPEGCPRYAARIIRDVKIGPSPIWMHDRLTKVGLRTINNIVDITNYVLTELGYPLHAFDYALLEDKQIRVRLSTKGEQFVTLDEKLHELGDDTVLICDGKRIVALGGIMGGQNTEVSEQTRDVLLECAYFGPKFISRSAAQLGISTEASVRFSRGVDPNGIPNGIDRAAGLMAQFAGGQVQKDLLDQYVLPIPSPLVNFRLASIPRHLGISLSSTEVEELFTRLGLGAKPIESSTNGKTATGYEVEIPTFRPDLTREIDLIEEISRITGYDKIPENYIASVPLLSHSNSKEQTLNEVREFMTGNGYSETVTNSMIPGSEIVLKYFPEETVRLQNPISEDMAVLRPSLVATLVRVAQFNLFRQNEDLKIFEIGSSYLCGDSSFLENLLLGGLMFGNAENAHWDHKSRPIDFFDVKGLIEDFFRRFSIPGAQYSPKQTWALDESSLVVRLSEDEVGFLGRLNPIVQQEYDLGGECFLFELNLDKIIPNFVQTKRFHSVPRFPWVRRDLSFVVDIETPGGKLFEKIQEWGGTNLKDIFIFDVYSGQQVPIGKKSIAFSLTFQANERTLTEDEVNEAVDQIIRAARNEFDAVLRG